MAIIKKCGQFMQDDSGHVVKRVGKNFKVPTLPTKMKEKYPEDPTHFLDFYDFFASIISSAEAAFKVDQRNRKREKDFQHQLKKEYLGMTALYYVGALKRRYVAARKSAHKICRQSLAFIAKTQRAYQQYRS